jgi:hypothetical protein
VKLVQTLLTDLKTTKVARSRFLQRLLPIQVTCKAYLDDISKAASTLFDSYFAEGNKTFSVIFKYVKLHPTRIASRYHFILPDPGAETIPL